MLTDTHTHLYLPDFDPDPAEVVHRALNAGVTRMIMPGIDDTSVAPMTALAARFPDNLSLALGLHPTEVHSYWQVRWARIKDQLADTPVVAVGEIGMDLYWDKSGEALQRDALDTQTEYALAHSLPVIIHCREALDQTLEVLSPYGPRLRGVMHSFSGSAADVERVLRILPHFYFGVNGILTFKKSELPATLKAIPPERLLLETDSPYLAPVPRRGRRNESAYVAYTAAHAALILGKSAEEIADLTSANASRLFGL